VDSVEIQSGERVLLTGAGFTHNFGTPLASGMWAEIFSHSRVQEQPNVRALLWYLGKFDFEWAYNTVLIDVYDPRYQPIGPFTREDKAAITQAVADAYAKLDAVVRGYKQRFRVMVPPPNPFTFRRLVAKLGEQPGKGFFFSLNQDLFIERQYSASPLPILPGFQENPRWFQNQPSSEPLSEEDYRQLPTQAEVAEKQNSWLAAGDFFYIKLHGSQNWRDATGEQRMVIGQGKEAQIEREPLLHWYHELFRDVLCKQNRRLLVIGYSFRDDHINRIINEACRDHGLKVYVVDPTSPEKFQANLLLPEDERDRQSPFHV
jgi:hypothetical protein